MSGSRVSYRSGGADPLTFRTLGGQARSQFLVRRPGSRPDRGARPFPRRRARWSIWAVLMSAPLALLLAKSYEPYRRASEEHARVILVEREAALLRAERAQLQTEMRPLATTSGQQEEARRQGYIWPGERLIVFVDPDPGKTRAGGAVQAGEARPAAGGEGSLLAWSPAFGHR